jgi:hypothetical protein
MGCTTQRRKCASVSPSKLSVACLTHCWLLSTITDSLCVTNGCFRHVVTAPRSNCPGSLSASDQAVRESGTNLNLRVAGQRCIGKVSYGAHLMRSVCRDCMRASLAAVALGAWDGGDAGARATNIDAHARARSPHRAGHRCVLRHDGTRGPKSAGQRCHATDDACTGRGDASRARHASSGA